MRYETEEGVIREFFTAEYGPVTSVKVSMRERIRPGRPRGGGFCGAPPPRRRRRAPSALPPRRRAQIITDRETGNSKGFSFVTFSDERDAEKALLTGTGKLLDGAPIKINVARSQMPPRGAGGPFERGRGRGRWALCSLVAASVS
jgi:hypothetical protein